MGYCAYICDNVTTCDIFIFSGCHAVTHCFVGVCDNVTTYIAHTHTHTHTHAHDANIRNIMSHCHNNKRINKLNRDNLQKSIVTGRHCDNGTEVWVCGGELLTNITWFLTSGTRLASQGVKGAYVTRLGRPMMRLLMDTLIAGKHGCWGFAKQKSKQLGYAMAMLVKKVLPAGSRYGTVTRRVSLVSGVFSGVSFRFL